jgi:hypothetical protein
MANELRHLRAFLVGELVAPPAWFERVHEINFQFYTRLQNKPATL